MPAVIDATGRAAAERLARFDIELDLDDTNEWGWLDVTHTLTYLNALRWAWSATRRRRCCAGCSTPPGSCSGPASSTTRNGGRWRLHGRTDAGRADVHRAIVGRDPEAAVALVDGYRRSSR